MMVHWQPVAGGAYGSSPFPTGPHTDGTYAGAGKGQASDSRTGAKKKEGDEHKARSRSDTHQVVFGRLAVADQAAKRVLR